MASFACRWTGPNRPSDAMQTQTSQWSWPFYQTSLYDYTRCIFSSRFSGGLRHAGKAYFNDGRPLIYRGTIVCFHSPIGYQARSLWRSRITRPSSADRTDARETGPSIFTLWQHFTRTNRAYSGYGLGPVVGSRSHRVDGDGDGLSWNGQTYDSLSKVRPLRSQVQVRRVRASLG